MTKAQITTAQGIQVKIEGTPAEITAIVRQLESKNQRTAPTTQRHRRQGKPGRASLVDQIGSLIDGGFFKKARDLASIKHALAEMGHRYPVTTLSPVMLRLVRRRDLRRVREAKRWAYIQ